MSEKNKISNAINQSATMIGHSMMFDVLDRGYRTNLPILVLGPTGIGKSYTVRQVAKKQAAEQKLQFVEWNDLSTNEKLEMLQPAKIKSSFLFVDARLCQMEYLDLRGLMKLGGDNAQLIKALKDTTLSAEAAAKMLEDSDYTKSVPLLLFKVLSHDDAKGLLFFDEMNLADNSVLKAAYQIVYDRQIGEISLGKGVYVVAAGNRQQDCADVVSMPKPLHTRFVNFELKSPSAEAWVRDYAVETGCDPRVISYLSFYKDRLNTDNPEEQRTATFPCPRTWDMASTYIKGLTDVRHVGTHEDKREGLIEVLVGGCVGPGAAKEFVNFLRIKQDRPLQDYLQDPKLVKEMEKNSDELDKFWALLSNLAMYYGENPKTPVLKQIIEICDTLNEEFGVLLGRLSKNQAKDKFVEQCPTFPKGKQFLSKIFQYVVPQA